MWKRKNCNGTLTLEAAIVVPTFILLMLMVNGLFIMFMGYQVMSHALVQSAKSLAFDPYAVDRAAADKQDAIHEMILDISGVVSQADNGDRISVEKWYDGSADPVPTIKKRFAAYLKASPESADLLLKTIGVKDGMAGLDFSGSCVNDGVLTVKLKYKQEFIFNVGGLAAFDRELSVKVKLFQYKN